jgi:hypothetical protein
MTKRMNAETRSERSAFRNVLELVLGVGDSGRSERTNSKYDHEPRFFPRRDGA